jgi:hypothetical protein
VWVEGGDIQDELFDQLGAVLTAPAELPLVPSAAELEALASAVAARWPDGAAAPAPASGPSPVHRLRSGGPHPLRRLGSSAWRASSAAAAMVVLSASAAAAAGGVPLPRPVRAVAYTVGLPVDSPALDDTKTHIKELKDAVKANDKPKAVATAKRLTTDLTHVPAEEKQEAVQKVDAVMVQAAPLIQSPAPTTATTTAPASSSTTGTSPAPSTTATTAAVEEKAPAATTTTTTTAPATTTTVAEPTTTTTAPAPAPSDPGGTTSGNPGTGSGDQGSGGPAPGGGDQGSTTPTTTPDTTTTTTTTAPPPETTTTTTTSSTTTSTTTTTTEPPAPNTGP